MDVFNLSASIRLDTDEYERGLEGAGEKTSKFGESLKSGLANAAKVGAAAIGAATAAVGALAKIGVDYNSQMEQYTTNFTTMLGSQEAAIQKVNELKKFAASTPLSMSDLATGTQTLLAFGVASEDSTDILRQLGDIALGDADKMQRLSTAFGKANAQGKLTGETVQQMIDAGYNPLIGIAAATGESMEDLQKRMSEGKVTVDELKAALNAATSEGGQFAGGMEAASKTFAGQMSTLKDNAMSLVGEVFQPLSAELTGNILPATISAVGQITSAFQEGGLSGAMDAFGTVLSDGLNMVISYLPQMVDAGMQLLGSLGEGLIENLPAITDAALQIVTTLATGLIEALPDLATAAVDIITTLSDGLSEQLPTLVPVAIDAILQLATTLTDPDNLGNMVDSALQLITSLADGLIEALPNLIEKAPEIVGNLVDAIVENAPKLLSAAFELVTKLASGIIDNLPEIGNAAIKIVNKLIEGVGDLWEDIKNVGMDIIRWVGDGISDLIDDALQWGKDLIDNFVGGIKSGVQWVIDAVSGVADTVKDFLGFSEPDKGPLSNFHTYAPDMMQLFAQGITDNAGLIEDTFNKALDFKRNLNFGTAKVGFESSAVGVSTAAMANTAYTAAQSNGSAPMTLNLMFPDGTKFASYYFDPMTEYASANGTPIINPKG